LDTIPSDFGVGTSDKMLPIVSFSGCSDLTRTVPTPPDSVLLRDEVVSVSVDDRDIDIVGAGVKLGAAANFGAMARLGAAANLGAMARLGAAANLGAMAKFGLTANFGAAVRLGAMANLGAGANLGAAASLGAAARVGATAAVGTADEAVGIAVEAAYREGGL